jgi:uncharacterized protein
MTPFNEFIVKVASRCNLNCSYCYEYNLGDDSWRGQAAVMSETTCRTLAERVRQHALTHSLPEVTVSFHGGEPLLLGAEKLDRYVSLIRDVAGEDFEVSFCVQTNATLIDNPFIEVLRRHHFSVGVSLDGGKAANDRSRVDHRDRSSYEATIRGIENLQNGFPGQPDGLLAVVDLHNDPLEVFDALAALGVPHLDFLLPHYHWDNPPPRLQGDPHEYGFWYLRIFDAWVSGRHPGVDIRFLRNIVQQLVGGPGDFEAMNLAPAALVTITTDGEIEGVDCLKSTSSGLQKTGLNIGTHSFDEALQVRLLALRQAGFDQLCTTCQRCKYSRVCAGGYFPHRFSKQSEFMNPSVYCTDLYWLIDQIESRIRNRARVQQNVGI